MKHNYIHYHKVKLSYCISIFRPNYQLENLFGAVLLIFFTELSINIVYITFILKLNQFKARGSFT